MFWCDQVIAGLAGPETINDSKTPSGRAHVGALRGPLIHDAIFRTLRADGIPARYLFGSDDYDPVDEIPYGEAEHFGKYLGAPLCNVPPPPGSTASDMADHFIREFWSIFAELGIKPEFYRMRDVYRSGRFNEAIDTILRNAPVVRGIYKEVSGADRPDTWHPFQVICETCGRIGTTVVTAYDGGEVTYECRPDWVKWARGCGARGKTSPFDGRGKLPWKLEWCAKWQTFPVTIEGAGRDHSTKGGSRDVAMACLRAIFHREPPMNCPYDFFLVGGAKMSSSRGVGVTARQMADFLPPEILRFLMIRPPPKQHVNFEPSEAHVLKLFNEFDRYHNKYQTGRDLNADERRIYELARVEPGDGCWVADFQLVSALIQFPHIDLVSDIERRKGQPLTDADRQDLQRRIRAARFWLEHYAADHERTHLQESLPASASQLTATQVAFLHVLANRLPGTSWNAEEIQSCVFDAARRTPLDQPSAFKAIYRVLIDRESGPKAGNLLSFLDRDFVLRRFSEPVLDRIRFWKESGIEDEEFLTWISSERANVHSVAARIGFMSLPAVPPAVPSDDEDERGAGVIELFVTLSDGKTHCKRVLFPQVEEPDASEAAESRFFDGHAREWLAEFGREYGFEIACSPIP